MPSVYLSPSARPNLVAGQSRYTCSGRWRIVSWPGDPMQTVCFGHMRRGSIFACLARVLLFCETDLRVIFGAAGMRFFFPQTVCRLWLSFSAFPDALLEPSLAPPDRRPFMLFRSRASKYSSPPSPQALRLHCPARCRYYSLSYSLRVFAKFSVFPADESFINTTRFLFFSPARRVRFQFFCLVPSMNSRCGDGLFKAMDRPFWTLNLPPSSPLRTSILRVSPSLRFRCGLFQLFLFFSTSRVFSFL